MSQPLPDQRLEYMIELQEQTNKLLEEMLELLRQLALREHVWKQ